MVDLNTQRTQSLVAPGQQTSANVELCSTPRTTQSPAVFSNSLLILPQLAVSARVLWVTLSHGVYRITYSSLRSKELVVDQRRTKTPVTLVTIQGVSMKIVEDYKSCTQTINWNKNHEAIYKKGQSHLHFLRRMMFFNIWQGSNVVWVELDCLMAVSERRMLSQLHAIMDNVSHPLHIVLIRHRSMFSHRLDIPQELIPACGHQTHPLEFQTIYTRLALGFFTPISTY